jgi:hypothetical protein
MSEYRRANEQKKIDEEIEKREKEAHEKQKKWAIAEATMNYAKGMVNVWTTAMNYRFGIGIPLGIAASGLLTASYGTQIGLSILKTLLTLV